MKTGEASVKVQHEGDGNIFLRSEVKFPSGLRIVTIIDSNSKFKPEAQNFQNGARVEQVISRCPSQLRSDISDSVFLNRWITVDLNVAIQLIELQKLCQFFLIYRNLI